MSTLTASLPAQKSDSTQPIAGVVPAAFREVTVMTVWPSVAMFGLGRIMGRLFSMRWPDIYFLRIGNLFALLSIPVALVLYFARVAPGIGIRYRLTNRRIIVERGLQGVEEKAVDLDRFDAIAIDVLPGQEWYNAGDLVFRLGNVETFRLEGVSRPEAFRETCLKSHIAHSTVKRLTGGGKR